MIKYSRSNTQLCTYAGTKVSSLGLEKFSHDRGAQLDWATRTQAIDPRIKEWVCGADLDFDKYCYSIVCPLGSDESWEETVNGDAFERSELEPKDDSYGHWTFTINGKAYHHHQNDDPLRSYGDLPFMVFNNDSDRCEGIWRLDRDQMRSMQVEYVGDRIDRGEDVAISMGCRVPYDVCSICENKAPTPEHYCGCTRDPGFGSILPDGRKVRVFNPRPSFFDLSDVIVNAAPEAFVMGGLMPQLAAFLKSLSLSKTSGSRLVVPSSVLAAYYSSYTPRKGFNKVSSMALKLSDMVKVVPALSARVIDPLMAQEGSMSERELKRVHSACGSIHGALSNMAASGIILKPDEFKQLLLLASTDPEGAEVLHGAGVNSTLVTEAFSKGGSPLQFLADGAVTPHGLRACSQHVERRSILYPQMAIRVHGVINGSGKGRLKLDFVSSTDEPTRHLSGAYGAYLRSVAKQLGKLLEEAIRRYPDLARTEVIAHPRVGADVKLSGLDAQAILPAAYLCKLAGISSPDAVTSVVTSLNTPGAAPYLGGVIF